MVKVVIDNKKGLVSKVGSGMQVKDQLNWNKHPYHLDTNTRTHTDNHTMTASDVGRLHIIQGSHTMTLPATTVGHSYSFVVDGSGTLTLNPNSNDKIIGAGAAGADNKDLTLTGDGAFIRLMGDGDDGWAIVDVAVTTARES